MRSARRHIALIALLALPLAAGPARAVMPAWLPGSLTDFVDFVIPELRRRGLVRTEYEETTLRGHLGLPMPASRFRSLPMVAE